ncbi:MAG: thymidine kinase [Eubacteriales bacterium]|nr:thymidine kinase [Eubacteriales bacterium]
MAKLYFRYGAMNSGKSTNLLQVAHNYEERGMRVYLIKVRADSKGGEQICSRLGISRKVDFLLDPDSDLRRRILEEHAAAAISCILVDEAQFLSRKHCDQLFDLVIDAEIPVICYGLRSDFRREAFEGSDRLMLLAHSIEELKTVCACGRKAIFNARKINGRYVFEGAQLAIDGEDSVEYESLCGVCYQAARASAATSSEI